MSVYMEPIYTQTVGAGGLSGSIIFNNIPQTYNDIVLTISARTQATGSTAAGLYLQVNGGEGAGSHAVTRFNANGSGTQSSDRSFGYAGDFFYPGGTIPDATATANTFSSTKITFTNYSGGTFKPILSEGVSENNGAYATQIIAAGSYLKSKPITSLVIGAGNFTYAGYSTFTLYGIKRTNDTAIPVPPTIGTPTDIGGAISVPFTADPSSDRSKIYAVTSTPTTGTTYGAFSPITVTGIAKDTPTTFQVSAVNSVGTSPSSASSSISTSNDFASIATQTLANNTTGTVYFTNIPQHYQHLQLRFFGQLNYATLNDSKAMLIQFNGDTGNNYSTHYLWGSGSAASAGANYPINAFWGPLLPSTNQTIAAWGGGVVDIGDYNNFYKNKTAKVIGGYDTNGAGYVQFHSGTWYNNAPISSIMVVAGGVNFNTGATIALYGMG